MDALARISPVFGLGGLAVTLALYLVVRRYPEGSERMREISGYIYEGAMAFLKREYQFLVFFVIAVAGLLAWQIAWQTAAAFVFGALCSVLSGYIGMQAATRANVRTAQAA